MTTGFSCLSLIVIKSKFSYLFLFGMKLTPHHIMLIYLLGMLTEEDNAIQRDVKHFTQNRWLFVRIAGTWFILPWRTWSFYEERESSFINFFSQDDSKISHIYQAHLWQQIWTYLCALISGNKQMFGAKITLGFFG